MHQKDVMGLQHQPKDQNYNGDEIVNNIFEQNSKSIIHLAKPTRNCRPPMWYVDFIPTINRSHRQSQACAIDYLPSKPSSFNETIHSSTMRNHGLFS